MPNYAEYIVEFGLTPEQYSDLLNDESIDESLKKEIGEIYEDSDDGKTCATFQIDFTWPQLDAFVQDVAIEQKRAWDLNNFLVKHGIKYAIDNEFD